MSAQLDAEHKGRTRAKDESTKHYACVSLFRGDRLGQSSVLGRAIIDPNTKDEQKIVQKHSEEPSLPEKYFLR